VEKIRGDKEKKERVAKKISGGHWPIKRIKFYFIDKKVFFFN